MIATNHGMIVTLASLSAYITPPLMVPYACTKAAALAFHEGLGVELKTHYEAPGVKTLCVCPGWARTRLSEGHVNTDRWFSPTLSAETVAEAVVGEVLRGRGGVVVLPRVHEWVGACVRGWPWWAQEGVRMMAGEAVRGIGGRELGKGEGRGVRGQG